jgi:NOL1/NOP2/fmu family ribosome biogenesis protein
MEELCGEVLPVATEEGWGITGSLLEGFHQPVCRFIPGYTRGEGLFMAVVRKPGKWPVHNQQATCLLPTKAANALNILYDGLPKAEKKGKDLIPSHAEALKQAFDMTKYALVALDYPAAIAYLRGEAVALPADTPRGFVVVTFQWRIKSTHIPEEYETILRLA